MQRVSSTHWYRQVRPSTLGYLKKFLMGRRPGCGNTRTIRELFGAHPFLRLPGDVPVPLGLIFERSGVVRHPQGARFPLSIRLVALPGAGASSLVPDLSVGCFFDLVLDCVDFSWSELVWPNCDGFASSCPAKANEKRMLSPYLEGISVHPYDPSL